MSPLVESRPFSLAFLGIDSNLLAMLDFRILEAILEMPPRSYSHDADRCSVPELVTVYQPPLSVGWPSSCSLPNVGRQLLTLGVTAWHTSNPRSARNDAPEYRLKESFKKTFRTSAAQRQLTSAYRPRHLEITRAAVA